MYLSDWARVRDGRLDAFRYRANERRDYAGQAKNAHRHPQDEPNDVLPPPHVRQASIDRVHRPVHVPQQAEVAIVRAMVSVVLPLIEHDAAPLQGAYRDGTSILRLVRHEVSQLSEVSEE